MDQQQPLFPIASSAPASSSQLFPVSSRTGLQASSDQESHTWLSNPSFRESLLPSPAPIPDWYVEHLESDKQEETNPSVQNTDTLLTSSCDEHDKDGSEHDGGRHSKRDESTGKRKRSKEFSHRHERKKDKKRKKLGGKDVNDARKFNTSQSLHLHGHSSRWVDIENKDYQLDARGDRDILVYKSLYRKHVPLFYRHQIRIWSNNQGRLNGSIFSFIHSEEDDAIMDEKLRERRYWSAKVASLERRKDFRRLKIVVDSSKHRAGKHGLLDFVPLEESNAQEESEFRLQEESWDGYIIRKTKEYNQLTRERPQDESLWIAFANFQDELIKATSKKAAVQQALEKKIAVLEKALEVHPFSEDLWLLFLNTCRRKDLATALLSKWESAIRKIPWSYRLWRAYLHFRLGEFSLFTVSSVRKIYIHALQTYMAAHKLKAEKIEDSSRAEMEKDLVSLFVDLCRFEWQTGHHEFAVGLFQAQIEYCIFSPMLDVTERSKKRLFNEFWDSGAPRIGEDGAVGWATWLQEEEEWIQKALAKEQANDVSANENETGGWTGWFEPQVDKGTQDDQPISSTDGPALGEDVDTDVKDSDEDDDDAEVIESEENEQDEAMLLERLGLSFEAGQELEVKDSATWKRWSEKEYERDSVQWLPVRVNNLKSTHDDGVLEAEEQDEQLERAVLFEDIQEALFSLETADARVDLICHFTDFCSGPYPQWCCSNSSKWIERTEALEHLFGPFLKELESAEKDGIFQKLVGGVEWMHESEGRCNFLANSLLLLRPLVPQNFWLQEKLLTVEGHRTAKSNGSTGTFGPRVLAKRLLKNDRQAILLLGAYACAEASAGNLDVARRVFDTTLASLNSLPTEVQVYGPIVYELYAEVELSQTSNSAEREFIHQKVLHILTCLGSGMQYTVFKADNPVKGTDILRAKFGFKEQIQNARKRRNQADLSDHFGSFVVCASIFELLSDGLRGAALIFEESFAMSLPGKLQQNLQFELLQFKYIKLLEEHKQSLKPTHLRRTILHGLAHYPSNPQLLGAYVRCCARSRGTNDLRRFFDDVLLRNPSTVLWLFAISIELGRPGSGPRIHSLFEKALETVNTQQSVVLWRCYMAYELDVRGDMDAARRVYFRAIHACPWSKLLWLDGFKKMSTRLSAKELSDFQDIMREKELRLRTDVYEIMLEDEAAED